MNISNLKESNNYIINLLQKNEPFIISRLGFGSETFLTIIFSQKKKINNRYLFSLQNNAGIYFNNLNEIIYFCNKYEEAISNSKCLATFIKSIINEQSYFINKYKLFPIHSRSIEPFYAVLEDIKPWTHYLINKKVLIINPFVNSFQKQLKNGFRIFKDKYIFLPEQKFVFYKSFNTAAGNRIHKSWIETFIIMCKDISKLDFDIALLGCGGYGLPLCNFIKTKLNKSAIYIGGGLQLLFGVMGKRWKNIDNWKEIIRKNDCKFIRPSGNEILKNNKNIEGGCYW